MAVPQYKVARICLEVCIVAGGLAVALGVVAFIMGAVVPVTIMGFYGGWGFYSLGLLLVLNGFVVIASAQLGFAMIDTAISTREMADLMARQVRRDLPQSERREPGLSLRAER